jgi:hypothetical protein
MTNREIFAPVEFDEILSLDEAFEFFDGELGAADSSNIKYEINPDSSNPNSLHVTQVAVYNDFIPIITAFYTDKFSNSVADPSLLREVSVKVEQILNDGEASILVAFKAKYLVNLVLPIKKIKPIEIAAAEVAIQAEEIVNEPILEVGIPIPSELVIEDINDPNQQTDYAEVQVAIEEVSLSEEILIGETVEVFVPTQEDDMQLTETVSVSTEIENVSPVPVDENIMQVNGTTSVSTENLSIPVSVL